MLFSVMKTGKFFNMFLLKNNFSSIVLLYDQKYQKSARRTHAVLLPNHRGVHELVARSSAWQVCTARDKSKIGGFALSTVSAIPRVRTYRTRKPSRFVHALSARPLKVQGGRDSSTCADETIKTNPISLCSHPDTHPTPTARFAIA